MVFAVFIIAYMVIAGRCDACPGKCQVFLCFFISLRLLAGIILECDDRLVGYGNPCQVLKKLASAAGCRSCNSLDNPLNHAHAVVLSGFKAHFTVQGIEALPAFPQQSPGIGQFPMAAVNRPGIPARHPCAL